VSLPWNGVLAKGKGQGNHQMHDFFSEFAAQQEKAISITKTADPHPNRQDLPASDTNEKALTSKR
jgi:hypothetical protein